ncbi:sensor histidine kinase [Dactylosporangium sp. NPDC049525]|uniref:sensor histidine kinase n=1 Tax=Dactylosporangium sp. NPDC049525 TaxID=3154730 RepID=UPI0034463392
MRRPFATDLAIAAVVCVVALVTTRGVPAAGLIPAAVACGALVARRRTPFTVFLVSSVAAEVYLVVHHGNGGVLILAAPLIALYTLAEAGSRRRALTIGVLAVLAFAGLHMLIKPSSWLGAENLALAALGGLAVAAGDGARSRREYLAEVEARARQAEHDRDLEAARRVADERLRIARDLHDVVGHQLALIHVQAGVAAHLLDASPGGAREALGHVRHASHAALGDLRDTIGLLRQPDEQLTPTQPVIGLAGLPDLLATFRRLGLTVEAATSGDDTTVRVPVDVTAYRLVQEALTNVRKHAGPTTAHVTLHYRPEALEIAVDNPAPCADPSHPVALRGTRPPDDPGGADAVPGGLGLVGMRERVAALGGTLQAGPRPGGGFRVTAVLPRAAP